MSVCAAGRRRGARPPAARGLPAGARGVLELKLAQRLYDGGGTRRRLLAAYDALVLEVVLPFLVAGCASWPRAIAASATSSPATRRRSVSQRPPSPRLQPPRGRRGRRRPGGGGREHRAAERPPGRRAPAAAAHRPREHAHDARRVGARRRRSSTRSTSRRARSRPSGTRAAAGTPRGWRLPPGVCDEASRLRRLPRLAPPSSTATLEHRRSAWTDLRLGEVPGGPRGCRCRGDRAGRGASASPRRPREVRRRRHGGALARKLIVAPARVAQNAAERVRVFRRSATSVVVAAPVGTWADGRATPPPSATAGRAAICPRAAFSIDSSRPRRPLEEKPRRCGVA